MFQKINIYSKILFFRKWFLQIPFTKCRGSSLVFENLNRNLFGKSILKPLLAAQHFIILSRLNSLLGKIIFQPRQTLSLSKYKFHEISDSFWITLSKSRKDTSYQIDAKLTHVISTELYLVLSLFLSFLL